MFGFCLKVSWATSHVSKRSCLFCAPAKLTSSLVHQYSTQLSRNLFSEINDSYSEAPLHLGLETPDAGADIIAKLKRQKAYPGWNGGGKSNGRWSRSIGGHSRTYPFFEYIDMYSFTGNVYNHLTLLRRSIEYCKTHRPAQIRFIAEICNLEIWRQNESCH